MEERLIALCRRAHPNLQSSEQEKQPYELFLSRSIALERSKLATLLESGFFSQSRT